MATGRLASIPFFKEPGVDLSPYETRCHWRRFDENETLVDYDDISTDVYFLATGEVRILNRSQSGKEVILGEMRRGPSSANSPPSTGSAARPTSRR